MRGIVYVPFSTFNPLHHLTAHQGAIVQELDRAGVQTFLVVGSAIGTNKEIPIKIINTNNTNHFSIVAYFREIIFMISLLHKLKPDFVIAYHYGFMGSIIGIYSKIISKLTLRRRKIVLLLQVDWDGIIEITGLKKAVFVISFRISTALFHKVIAQTTCLMDNLRKNFPNLRNLVYIPNGSYFQNEIIPLERDNVVLCVASISPRKGLHTLLSAFSKVVVQFPSWKLKFVGGIVDHAYYIMLKSMVEKLYLEESVQFLLEVTIEQLKREYQRASIFCLPSTNEGWGTARAEAASFGLPIITTNAGCGSDFKHAVIVPREDTETLTIALRNLIENPSLRLKLGNESAGDVRSWGKVASDLISAIEMGHL